MIESFALFASLSNSGVSHKAIRDVAAQPCFYPILIAQAIGTPYAKQLVPVRRGKDGPNKNHDAADN